MSNEVHAQDKEKLQRLPCRGCLPDCPNYANCEGTPWRIDKIPKPTLN